MKDEPWRGDMYAHCLHLEAKLGRQAREIERMERNLAEAKALLRSVLPYSHLRENDPEMLLSGHRSAAVPLDFCERRDALLDPTTEQKETQQ